MAPTAYRCQQFPPTEHGTARTLPGIALVVLSCLGCWQEVRYEPAPTTRKTAASPAQQKPIATGVATDLLPVDAAGALNLPVEPSDVDLTSDDPVGSGPLKNQQTGDGQTNDGQQANQQSRHEQLESVETPRLFEPVVPAPDAVAPGMPSPDRLALATWQMSSRWSMAAALQAKGRGPDGYREHLEVAMSEANLLGVPLSALPTHEAGADLVGENLTFLLEVAGPRLASVLSKQYGAEHAALAELATKTHVLLLSYTPSSTRLEPVIASVRQAAQQSGLPDGVWKELVDLLTARAEFKRVKAAIFQLHERAIAHLRGRANG